MKGGVALVEHYIAAGFGLSMFMFFVGQSLRLLIDVVNTTLGR
jgi:hypothetical protein